MNETPEVNLEGIAPCFHEVVRKYGRDIFILVWGAQMAGEAAKRLAEQAAKRQSNEIAKATAILSESYNMLAALLVESQGWTPELIAQVDRDAQMAFAGSIQVASPVILMQ